MFGQPLRIVPPIQAPDHEPHVEDAGVFGPVDFADVDAKIDDNAEGQAQATERYFVRIAKRKAADAAVGLAEAAGGVLGELAAALPYLDNASGEEVTLLVDDEGRPTSRVLATGTAQVPSWHETEAVLIEASDAMHGIPFNGDLMKVNVDHQTDFPDIFSGRGVDCMLDEAPEIDPVNPSPHALAVSMIYVDEMTPEHPDWGKYVANKHLAAIRAELGLESFTPEKVKPILERVLDDETFLFETNRAIACGVFNGLKPSSRMDTVEPLPVAVYVGEDFADGGWAYDRDTAFVGLTQAECDALQPEVVEEVTTVPDALQDALDVVVGSFQNGVAAAIADTTEELRRYDVRLVTGEWGRSPRTHALDHASAKKLVESVAGLANDVAPERVRKALRDLADRDDFWAQLAADDGAK